MIDQFGAGTLGIRRRGTDVTGFPDDYVDPDAGYRIEPKSRARYSIDASRYIPETLVARLSGRHFIRLRFGVAGHQDVFYDLDVERWPSESEPNGLLWIGESR